MLKLYCNVSTPAPGGGACRTSIRQRLAAVAGSRGSAIVWAMAVSVVLLIIAGIIAMAVSASYRNTARSQDNTQAYYTARSVEERILGWLSNTPVAAGDAAATDQQALIANLIEARQITQHYSEEELGGKMGYADVVISINDDDNEIRIETTARFNDDKHTTVATLTALANGSYSVQEPDIPKGDSISIDPGAYDDHADELNAFEPDPNPVYVGNQGVSSSLAARAVNDADRNALNQYITEAGSSRESRFVTNFNQFASKPSSGNSSGSGTGDAFAYSLIQGTMWNGSYGDGNYTLDKANFRQFLPGVNGRLAVNPSLADNYPNWTNDKNNVVHQLNSNTNTKFTMLSVGETAGKDISIRLSSDEVGTGANLANMKWSQQTRPRYNAVIGLDFTGYASTLDGNYLTSANQYVDYLPNNLAVDITPRNSSSVNATNPWVFVAGQIPTESIVQNLWYPRDWNSATIYTQDTNDAAIDTRLVFSPYAQLYRLSATPDSRDIGHIYFGFWNWEQYSANPLYGQTKGSFWRTMPATYNRSSHVRDSYGMPVIPQYWGPSFNLYLTDNIGPTEADKADAAYCGNQAWMLQGVNVLGEAPGEDLDGNGVAGERSVLYSDRGLTLGGVPHRNSNKSNSEANSGWTYEGLNSALDGWYHVDGDQYLTSSSFPNPTETNHVADFLTRFSTIYYNTDLILKTPEGTATPRSSRINAPSDWRQASADEGADSIKAFLMYRALLQTYEPTTRFIGGDILVDAGQTLTIAGGGTIHKNPTGTINPSGWVDTGVPNMRIAPDKLLVREGGTLVLEPGTAPNIYTDIYIDGGTLQLDGGNVAGTIYCYNGGKVIVNGSCYLYTPEDGGIEGIIISDGATIVMTPNADLCGDVYVLSDGAMIIDGGGIKGDIHCAGSLTINGSFVINHPDDLIDNPNTVGLDEGVAEHHGVFVYNRAPDYVAELHVNGTPTCSGNAGKVHTFLPYPDLQGLAADNLFCDHRDRSSNRCLHSDNTAGYWVRSSAEAG